MIDMSKTQAVLVECTELAAALHGQELDETDAVSNQSKGEARRQRAQLSQDLNFLATRLELAAALVRVEYWWARGEDDPTTPGRADGSA